VNIGQIAKMAQQMQTQMAHVQAELRETTLEATAGGGAVRVIVTGAQEVRLIEIDPAAVDPADVEMLQDLVTAAVNEALDASRNLAEQKMGALSALGGLGGLLGR
jgi:nucleoid-associated protein EbfC